MGGATILYLIVGLLVAGAVLGPLLSALPSKHQRYLAAQRETAEKSGLTVRFRPLPELPPRFRVQPPLDPMSYELRVGPSTRVGGEQMYVLTPEGWVSREGGDRHPDALKMFPGGVFLLTVNEERISAVWDELGGPEAVVALAQALKQLLKELHPDE